MKSSFGAGVLVKIGVVLAALGAAYPLYNPLLPHGTDTLTHLYTVIPLERLFQHGVFFSRWAPYRASGFGTPLFNYYAPLAYYSAQAFRVLGVDAVAALRMALGLSLVGGAVGVYLLTRDLFSAPAGLVAAAAYVCGPYTLYNTYFRGGLNEQYALLLMPWALWTLRRWVATKHFVHLALAAVAYAGVVLSHNLTALLFTPLLLAYAGVLAATADPGASAARGRARPFLPWLLGLGLSAFLWLPMLSERDAVASELLYRGAEFEFQYNFIPVGRLFFRLSEPVPRASISIVATGLALVAVLWAWRRGSKPRWEMTLLGLTATAYALMALPFSDRAWELARPVLQYLQFPQRFLGISSLCLSVLAGGGYWALGQNLRREQDALARSGWGRVEAVTLALAVGLLLHPLLTLSNVRYYPPLDDLDVEFVMRKEREAGNIFTTYVVSFIPRTVQEPPPFDLLAQDGPERLDVSALPSQARVLESDYHPLRYNLVLDSPQPFTAVFNTFYFAGWQGRIDGQPVQLMPDVPYGRICLEIPAGRHRLEVWFGTTPLRRLADRISLGSLLVLVVLALLYARRER